MDLALIGNCSYQALVDNRGSVVWLCWPRFDSSFVIGSLLDEERGGSFSIEPAQAEFTTKQHYLPNTNILRTVFESEAGSFELIDFAPRFRQYERFYKPNMLVRRVRRLSGRPSVRVRCNPTYDYGRSKLKSHRGSNHIEWAVGGGGGPLRVTTNAPLTYIEEQTPFLLEGDVYVVFTWGTPLEAALEESCITFLTRTRRYWETFVKHSNLPGIFQEEVVRSALALKLHQFEDTGAITAATTTSLPEHDGSGRNWDYRFCWLRDTYFTLTAMKRLSQFEETERFVGFLQNLVASSGGSESGPNLQPVYSISGVSELHEVELDHLAGYRGNQPVRAGNAAYKQIQNDVYGEMIVAMAPLFLDIRFSEHHTDDAVHLVKRLLERIVDTMEIPDAGIWEYRAEPQVFTFPLLMHWAGARMAVRIGRAIGDAELEQKATAQMTRAGSLIEEGAWRPDEGFYAESIHPENCNADASLFMMVNLGYLSPDNPRAESHVRRLQGQLSVRGHLMKRYEHFDGLGETVNTFTVCGFWAAEALARLGHTEEATRALEQLICHANHVGLFSEDLDPETGEQWGNFPQTYSHVGLINTAFAISPHASEL